MGQLTPDMRRVIEEQRLGFIATVCPDGTPNLSPKGTTAVWDDDHLIFADICSPQTVANLQKNPSIAVNVVDPVVRKGYRFKGQASIYTAGVDFAAMLAFYRQRGVANPIRAIIKVRVEQAEALISPAYDLGQTEEHVRGRWLAHWRAAKPRISGARNWQRRLSPPTLRVSQLTPRLRSQPLPSQGAFV